VIPEHTTDARQALRWAVGLPAVALLVGALLLVPALRQTGAGGAAHHNRPSMTYHGPVWTLTGPLQTMRFTLSVARLRDGRVLAVGGSSLIRGDLAPAEIYDPRSGRWAVSGALHYRRLRPAAALLPDGRVLVAGGPYSSTAVAARAAETYDPRTGRWSLTRPMAVPMALSGATATVLREGTVLVLGDGAAQTFDPHFGRWTDLHVRPGIVGINPAAAVLLRDGRVLVVNGDSFDVLEAVLYDPRTGRWTPTGHMPPDSGMAGEAVALLHDGRVLVVGGIVGDSYTARAGAALYDPRTNRWVRAASPRQRRAGAVAVTLPDGRVLLAGGGPQYVTPPSGVDACDLYDPRTGRWTATAPLHTPRALAAGTLLADGRVLVVGGAALQNFLADNGTRFTNDPLSREAEVFTP